jgi:hypothetical protein
MPKFVQRFLPNVDYEKLIDDRLAHYLKTEFVPAKQPFSLSNIIKNFPIILLGIACLGLSVIFSLCFFNELNTITIMIGVTSLALASLCLLLQRFAGHQIHLRLGNT